MKQHSNGLKENVKSMGKQIDSIITFGSRTLHDELYAVTPMFEGNLLKSIMKQLEVECSVDIPLETIINYQLGIKVGNSYEYLDYGNYVVIKSEKQEDKDTYILTCYDKMVYSMKDYEDLGITYPITLKNYLSAIATKIGLELEDTTFANEDREITQEIYLDADGKSLGYTYRDILDEIAQATGSNIIINATDKIEVKYFTDTEDTIDEEYLKDVNVKFGEKYGPINSIVLSRSAESDNIYIKDDESIEQNGLCEIKIADNQLMNDNNRVDYLADLLDVLDGLYFYINDFSSTGICYYDVCDLYNISIGENIYQCVMLNDEINITSGIEELVHTDMPEQSETDYKKASKTDRMINKAYIIVDKQNQEIEAVTERVDSQGSQITTLTQDVEGFEARVQDTTDNLQEQISQVDLNGILTERTTIGGQNLVKNSVGYFGNEYWQVDSEHEGEVYGNTSTEVKQHSTSGSALELQNETIYQTIAQIKNGSYYLSFSYRRLINTAVCKLSVNDTEITLNEDDWTDVEQPIEITGNSITLQISADIDDSCLVTDLNLVEGTIKKNWTQNSNESYTDNVQIGKGIKIKSTGTDTEFEATAGGILINNTNSNQPVSEFTKYGTKTEELIVKKDAQISESILIQKIGEQTWFSSL